jgi:AcrR family transcriptional regulator
MPTPARTSLPEIVEASRRILEAEGLDGLTMQRVAQAVGIRAPSLYKHVSGRGELIRLVVEAAVADLGSTLDAAVSGEDTIEDLFSLAHAFRRFAHDNPQGYRVMFAPLPEEWRPHRESLLEASRAVLRTTETMVGPDEALDAARFMTAWAHGFLTMELADAFRIEGNLDRAFDFGVDRIARALLSK